MMFYGLNACAFYDVTAIVTYLFLALGKERMKGIFHKLEAIFIYMKVFVNIVGSKGLLPY